MTLRPDGLALVTGASSGIGEAFARRLAADGWPLLLVARSQAKLQALAAEFIAAGGDCRVLAADLSRPGGVAAVQAFLAAGHLEVGLLINNAGVGAAGEFGELDLGRQQAMLELNVQSLAALTHACLGPMRRRGRGVIVNVTSIAGFLPVPYTAVYAASKAFVLSFSLALWAENRRHGVLVTAVAPGSTGTAFFASAGMTDAGPGAQSPQAVVAEAMAAVAARRRLVITGGNNRRMVRLLRWLPQRWVLAAATRFGAARCLPAAGAPANVGALAAAPSRPPASQIPGDATPNPAPPPSGAAELRHADAPETRGQGPNPN